MTTKCEFCGHQFTNFMLRRDCPRCGTSLKLRLEPAPAATSNRPADDGFDGAGFAIGMMTGVPLSPTHGISTGSILGAALHSNPAHSSPAPESCPTPASDPSPSQSTACDSSSSSSSSYDSSSSSSSSYDSSSSSSSSFDSGSSFGGDSGGSW